MSDSQTVCHDAVGAFRAQFKQKIVSIYIRSLNNGKPLDVLDEVISALGYDMNDFQDSCRAAMDEAAQEEVWEMPRICGPTMEDREI